MTEMQASEARERIEEMLARVEAGETVNVTRAGRTVAKLVPEEAHNREDRDQVFREIEDLRLRMPGVSVAEILEWRDEGRKR